MKVKSECEVAQSCLTLRDPMDFSPPGSSIHGIFQARVLEWGCHCLLCYEVGTTVILMLNFLEHREFKNISKIKVLTDSMSSEGSPPGLQIVAFLLKPHM